MSLSTATVTPTNAILSSMQVSFKGVDLGGTEGEVSVSPKIDLADIMFDQLGKTAVDKVVSGYAIMVKFILGEVKKKDNWKVVYPFSKLINATGVKGVYFDAQIGASLLASSGVLLLHPLSQAVNDYTEDYTFYKAASMNVSEVKYGSQKQVGLSCEMVIFPDTGTVPARFFLHGDPANGLVAPVFGSPSFTGTGNGVLSLISSGGKTLTENITIINVGIPGSHDGNWYVSGDVSGPLGSFELTGGDGGTFSFTSPAINFVITGGSTDFVLGDNFVIATTAPNYT